MRWGRVCHCSQRPAPMDHGLGSKSGFGLVQLSVYLQFCKCSLSTALSIHRMSMLIRACENHRLFGGHTQVLMCRSVMRFYTWAVVVIPDFWLPAFPACKIVPNSSPGEDHCEDVCTHPKLKQKCGHWLTIPAKARDWRLRSSLWYGHDNPPLILSAGQLQRLGGTVQESLDRALLKGGRFCLLRK